MVRKGQKVILFSYTTLASAHPGFKAAVINFPFKVRLENRINETIERKIN